MLPDNYTGDIDFGKESHLEFFYKKFYTAFLLYTNHIMKETEKSEELINDVFLKFHERKHSFKSVDEAQKVFFRSLRNKGVDILRNEKIIVKRSKEYEKIRVDEVEYYQGKQDDYPIEAILNLVDKHLPNAAKKIFRYRFIDNLSMAEICQKSGYKYQSVKSRIYESVSKLRELIKNDKELKELCRLHSYII